MEEKERTSFLGNVNEKTVIYNGSDINSSTVINVARQRAQELCQGKTPFTSDFIVTINIDDNIICAQNCDVTIDLTDETNYANKTIIAKNGNIILQSGMDESSPSLDIFIDKGLLYLDNGAGLVSFDNQGFPSSSGVSS